MPDYNYSIFELIFSFVSWNNTDVETSEQFILLYVCDFSGLTNFSQKLTETRRKHLYRTLFTSSVVLLLTHDEFFDAFQGKKFCLENVCLFQRLVIRQLIQKKLFPWPPVCLLALKLWASSFVRSVNFFLCFWSELATVWNSSVWDNSLSECSLSWLILERINFGSNKIVFVINSHFSSGAVRVFPALSLRRVGPSYGTFSRMVFQGNCAGGRTGHMIINN